MRDSGALSFDGEMRSAYDRSRYSNDVRTADRYDFKKGEKLSGDQERFVRNIFNAFSENVMIHLGALLQTRIQMNLASIRQRNYHSFVNSLPDPSSIFIFKIDDNTKGLVCIDFSLSFALLDKLMGGKGNPIDDVRVFTDLEKSVMMKPVNKILEAYGESWKEVKKIEPHFQEMELNPMAVHIVTPSEIMVVINFQVTIAQTNGSIDICIPFKYLKDNLPRSSFDEFLITRGTSAGSAQIAPTNIITGVEAAKIPLVVELGKSELLFQELLYIEVGDCIKLDVEVTAPMKLKVNDKTKFLGRPGVKDGKMSIQITKVISEGDEEFE